MTNYTALAIQTLEQTAMLVQPGQNPYPIFNEVMKHQIYMIQPKSFQIETYALLALVSL